MKRTLLISVAFALFVITAPRATYAVPMISVGPYTVPATPGTPFLVPIQITDAVELVAWGFGLTYDATDLQINDPAALNIFGLPVTEGDFYAAAAPFNLLNQLVIVLDGALNQTGVAFGANGAWGGLTTAPSGNGILAYVEFVAIGTGNSTIRVTDPSITSSAVPEPTTLLLLASGIAYLSGRGLIKRRRGTDM